MIKIATTGIINIVIVSLLILTTGIAEDKPEQKSTINHPPYTTQDDLIYLYSPVDEGLMDSREIYELDKAIYDIVSNPKKLNHRDFDEIDFELFTKGQQRINSF